MAGDYGNMTSPQDAHIAAADAQDRARRERFPPIGDELLRALMIEFPDRAPSRGDTLEDVWMAAGAAQVVRWLTHVALWQRNPDGPGEAQDAAEFTFTQALLADLDRM